MRAQGETNVFSRSWSLGMYAHQIRSYVILSSEREHNTPMEKDEIISHRANARLNWLSTCSNQSQPPAGVLVYARNNYGRANHWMTFNVPIRFLCVCVYFLLLHTCRPIKNTSPPMANNNDDSISAKLVQNRAKRANCMIPICSVWQK